ncbi:hypothetical protein [Halonatronum saccharophilum]|uniref:hypothetical protein n=1 Tax=Halonatronum saccharophilum TaxID=150060 RepID=UPI00048912C0|nr:hypothetical protein [Halonatronum saccharophilum]
MESYDKKVLFSSLAKKEKEDIKDFISYRDRVYMKRLDKKEIFNLQRALNIINNQEEELQENRLINLWAVLEYTLTFHEGLSIISKVKDIIPKLVCLYIFKDKLNIFWYRLFNFKDRKIKIVDDFIEECKQETSEYYYDFEKLTSFILKKGHSLIKDFDFNDVLKRDIAEIGMILSNSEFRSRFIKIKEEEIRCDLIRIYRIRNILIHSSKEIKSNLDHKSLRLYQYNHSLLGLIIYYKNKNPESTIGEILNSINYTYQKYLQILDNNDASAKEICKPDYLFIG